jgi:hypothetical protein
MSYVMRSARSLVSPHFSPANISDLQLWLDASDSSTVTTTSGAVTAWMSKDPNSRNFTQSLTSHRPSYSSTTFNGLNTMDFSDDSLRSTSTASTWSFLHNGTLHTGFFLVKFGKVANPGVIYGMWGNYAGDSAQRGAYLIWRDEGAPLKRMSHSVVRGVFGTVTVENQTSGGTVPSQQFVLQTLRADPGNSTLADRSEVVASGTTDKNNTRSPEPATADANRTLEIGSGGQHGTGVVNWRMTGEIAEMIIYAKKLSDAEYNSVVAYLEDKWGASL